MTAKITVPSLVDPLSVILSTALYIAYQELHHPHVLYIDALKTVMAAASPEQRAFVASRARIVRESSDAVTAALEAKH